VPISLSQKLVYFYMEDSKNPIARRWQRQPPLKTQFLSLYLYLVALLNLKVSYAFMFCYSMKDNLKTICYVFPFDLNTRLTFIVSLFMIFRLCFFSCYNMVAKFLLSRLCVLCPCSKFFDPSTQCLHRWSRLWWCMSPQKLYFCLSLTYSRTSRS
jgi:hypothetical protein